MKSRHCNSAGQGCKSKLTCGLSHDHEGASSLKGRSIQATYAGLNLRFDFEADAYNK